MVYRNAAQVDVSLDALPVLPRPSRVLLTSPDHFEIAYVINPHMSGHIGTVDARAARRQWEALHDAYASIGFPPLVLPGLPGLPDMVFCANQSLPFIQPATGRTGVVLGHMYAPERRDEVPAYEALFREMGYDIHDEIARSSYYFEGMGDAVWHPGRHLLWGGYGFRTDAAAYEVIARILDVPVVILQLDDPDFYHLDTCFCVLNEATVLIYPGAFTDEGLALIHRMFPVVLEATDDEARTLFACNAHCPDGRHVLIQRGCAETGRLLKNRDFVPVELDTDEFLKSGGSVFCMKLAFW